MGQFEEFKGKTFGGLGDNGDGNGHDDKPKSIPIVTQEDIDFVIATIKKEAAYDKPSIKQLFYGMATALTKLGMCHKVNSRDSGSGKSYLTGKVASYFLRNTCLFYREHQIKPFSIDRVS